MLSKPLEELGAEIAGEVGTTSLRYILLIFIGVQMPN